MELTSGAEDSNRDRGSHGREPRNSTSDAFNRYRREIAQLIEVESRKVFAAAAAYGTSGVQYRAPSAKTLLS
jgi:hypothetical protein